MPAAWAEDLHRHMQRAVHARRAVVDRAGLGLGRVDKVLQRLVGTVGAHDQHGGIGADQGDGRELVELVGSRPSLQAIGDRQHRDRRQRQQERVAVGRSARGLRGAHRAAGAGLVHHHDRLLDQAAHHMGERPRGDVGHAARREGHEDLDGLGRIGILRHGRSRGRNAGSTRPAATSVRRFIVSPPLVVFSLLVSYLLEPALAAPALVPG